jgi:outer membrane protein assembly factor BamB
MLSVRNLAVSICLFVGLAICPMSVMAKDANWPQFHGPRQDNISTETGLMTQWPEDGPTLVWTAEEIGTGWTGVTISDGRIFTAGGVEEEDATVVFCLDMDGKVVWQTPVGSICTAGRYKGARGTPTVDGDRVYYETGNGDVTCLLAATGEKVWSLNILDTFGAENIRWGLSESLVVDGDHLICCPFGEKASVVALDKMTGKTQWAAPSTDDQAGYGTPALVEHQGLRMILTMNAKALVGVNADTGELLFRHEHETRFDVNAIQPVFFDGNVFISSGYNRGSQMVHLEIKDGKVATETAWESKDMSNHHGGAVLLDGHVYGSSENKWVCYNWETGETVYAERGVGKGSLTVADGMLYTLSEKGTMGLVKATPQGHELVGKFKLPEGGEGRSWAHPVVCDGRLYLRHDTRLFVYDIRAK